MNDSIQKSLDQVKFSYGKYTEDFYGYEGSKVFDLLPRPVAPANPITIDNLEFDEQVFRNDVVGDSKKAKTEVPRYLERYSINDMKTPLMLKGKVVFVSYESDAILELYNLRQDANLLKSQAASDKRAINRRFDIEAMKLLLSGYRIGTSSNYDEIPNSNVVVNNSSGLTVEKLAQLNAIATDNEVYDSSELYVFLTETERQQITLQNPKLVYQVTGREQSAEAMGVKRIMNQFKIDGYDGITFVVLPSSYFIDAGLQKVISGNIIRTLPVISPSAFSVYNIDYKDVPEATIVTFDQNNGAFKRPMCKTAMNKGYGVVRKSNKKVMAIECKIA